MVNKFHLICLAPILLTSWYPEELEVQTQSVVLDGWRVLVQYRRLQDLDLLLQLRQNE